MAVTYKYVNGQLVGTEKSSPTQIQSGRSKSTVPIHNLLNRPPCQHLGEKTGETKDCISCGGSKQIPLYQCGIHGECTTTRTLTVKDGPVYKHYPWCMACKDYTPKTAPRAPTIAPATLPTLPPTEPEIMPLQWSYGVTTVWTDTYGRKHQGRMDQLLPRTLHSLQQGGFDNPILFVDGCDHHQALVYEKQFKLPVESRTVNIHAYGNWLLAILELYIRNPTAQRYALFQDDFVTYKNLKRYLEWSPYPSKGYLNLYTFPHNAKMVPKDPQGKRYIGWAGSNQRGLGAVGLVFNNEAVRTLITMWHMIDRVQGPDSTRAIDGGVVEAMRQGPIKYREYIHHPSLVQHTGIVSSMGNGQHSMSETFMGEDFDALELIKKYNAKDVPIPNPVVQCK